MHGLVRWLALAAFVPAAVLAQGEDLGALARALKDEDPLVRVNAADALRRLGPQAAPAVRDIAAAWSDANPEVARSAVAAMAAVGPASVPALVAILNSGDRSQRLNAISILKQFEDRARGSAEAAYPTLFRFMELDDPELRIRALQPLLGSSRAGPSGFDALREYERRRDEAGVRAFRIILLLFTERELRDPTAAERDEVVALLRRTLRHPGADFRSLAARGLGSLGGEAQVAVPDLVVVLNDRVLEVHRSAREALLRIGKPALPGIAALLTHRDVGLRRFAVEAIGRIGPERDTAGTYVPALVRALRDPDIDVRAAAAKSLGAIGPAAQDATPALVAALADRAGLVRREAAIALGRIGSRARAGLAADVKLLRGADAAERRAAAERIGAATGPLDEAIAPLLPLAGDRLADVQRVALDAIAKIAAEPVQAVAPLRALAAEPGGAERTAAARALEQLESVAKRVLPRLTDSLGAQDAALRREAAEGFERLAPYLAAAGAVPPLVKAFGDEDQQVTQAAASAVARFGPDALPFLAAPLKSASAAERSAAVSALDRIAPLTAQFVPILAGMLEQDDVRTVSKAVSLLGRLGAKAPEAVVPSLVGMLGHGDRGVRVAAASGLGAIGAPAQAAIPALTAALGDDERLNSTAVSALSRIAKELWYASDTQSLDALREANGKVRALGRLAQTEQAKELNQLVESLSLASWEQAKSRWTERIARHPVASAAIPLYLLWVVGWLGALRLRPAALLRINRALEPFTIQLPERFGGYRLPLRNLLFVGFLAHRPEVLDAWVGARSDSVRSRFLARDTVADRAVHIPVPVTLNRANVADLKAAALRPVFARRNTRLLIWGEGGSGKTSLACRIARLALSELPDERPTPHLMIPVLIEHEGIFEEDRKAPLRDAVALQVQDLCDEPEPLADAFLDRLLNSRRVLVIIDHLSEMGEAARSAVLREIKTFPAGAVIVTSRLEETLDGATTATLRPLRIAGNRLSSFMEAYLTHCGKRELFTDAEFFEACSRLSSMVRDRDVTPLFAKLFAEQMIAAKAGTPLEALPESIPDLMLHYANELNRGVSEDRLEDRTVHQAAKATAWECLRDTYRPGLAPYDDVVAVLKEEAPGAGIGYLEERLRLVQTIAPAKDRVRFVLDPLAEYFAAMHVVETHAGDEARWREFFERADGMGAPSGAIRGFLRAALDCVVAQGRHGEVPAWVEPELGRRVA